MTFLELLFKSLRLVLLVVLIFVTFPVTTFAVPTQIDWTGTILQPLRPDQKAAQFWAHSYFASSTTATSTFPIVSSTVACLGGVCRTSWPTDGSVSTTSASLEEFGANSTDATDDLSAIQAALEWSNDNNARVTCSPGTYLLSAPLEIPASADFLYFDFSPDCRFERTFTSTGIDGMITNADTAGAADGSTRPKNITIRGGDWGSPYTATATGTASTVTYTGNIFSFIADNLTLDGVHMNGLGSSGRFFLGGGDNFRILKPVWKHAEVDSGTGGARILAGSGLVADGEIISGDDTLAAVPGENGNFGDLSLGHVVFRDMRGTSTAARFFAVGLTNQTAGSQATFTASIGRVDCVRCSGAGADYGAIVTAVDTTGQIGEVNIVDSEFTDVSPTNGSLLYGILVDGGTGLSRNGNMGIGAVRLIRTRLHNTHGTAFQQIGEVGTIELDNFTADAPREAGAAAIIARQAQRMIARNVDVTPYAGENGYQIGTNTAGEEVQRFEVDGGIVRNVYHSGASTVRYGFNLVRTNSSIFINRPRVEVASSSTFVRFLGLSANTYNTNVVSADMRQISAGTPIQDLAEGTRYGRDILTATSTYRDASVLTATEGGTGTSTYSTGDFLYASAANTLSRLAIGSTGNILMVQGGVPTWTATSSLGINSSNWTVGGGFIYPTTGSTVMGNLLQATSTTGTSSLPNLAVAKLQATSSAGLQFFSNNGTPVADFGAGGGSNATFLGGVNIDGATRLATSLNGLTFATNGSISALATSALALGSSSLAATYSANSLLFASSTSASGLSWISTSTLSNLHLQTNEYDLFIIAGQSNAVAGAGDIASSTYAIPGTAKSFYEGAIIDVTNDIVPGNGGPWPAFANRYYQLTGRKVAFVHTAIGGTGLNATSSGGVPTESWGPEGTLLASSTYWTEQAIAAYRARGIIPVVKGILWSQGENDAVYINSLDQTAAQYRASLESVISRYRTALGTTTSFYIFRTGTHVVSSDSGYRQVRQEQENVAAADPNTYIVFRDSIDYVARGMMFDNVHYNQFGYNDMGRIGAEGVALAETEPRWWQVSNALVYNTFSSSSPRLLIGDIGTYTAPWASSTYEIEIYGDMRLSGALADSATSTGTLGQVLTSTGTSTRWVATSSLGISGGSGADGVSNWLLSGGALRPSSTVGIVVAASSTIGDGGISGGLTIMGAATSSLNSSAAAATTSNMVFYDPTNSNAWSTSNPWGLLTWRTGDAGFPNKTHWGVGPVMDTINGNNSNFGFFSDVNSGGLIEKMRMTLDGKLLIGTSSSLARLTVQSLGGAVDAFAVYTNAGTKVLSVINTQGATTTISGGLKIEGALGDSVNSIGTSGRVLTSSGTSTLWTATSSLGLSAAFTTSAALATLLSDETGTGNAVFSAAPTLTGTTTVGGLSIGSLTGILKAVAGAVVTALIDLATDVTGVLPIANGGTGTTTPKIWSTTIASTSDAFISSGLVPVPDQGAAYTITRIHCQVIGGTSKVIAIEDASGNSSEDITCTTSDTFDDGSITNASYTAWEDSFIDFGATSGAVDYVKITVFGN